MKLLNRTLRAFVFYAIAVLLIVTPVLYMVINNVIIRQVDETLQIHKSEIQTRLDKLPSETDVQKWEDLDGEVFVEPLTGPMKKDSIYTLDEYRVLESSAIIKGKPYKFQARISLVESEDLIQTLSIAQLVVLIILLSGMLIINWWNSKRVWNPFYKTLDILRSFQIERNKPLTLYPSKIAEFNELNDAIEELTKRDYKAFVTQREFTENAAHEMQTPLAVFQSKVELLLQTRPSEEQAPLIESILDATSRLNGLNKALLLLARIENRQFPETEIVDLLVLTAKLKGDGDIVVNVQGDGRVSFNRPLLEILLSNLISNAVRHSEPGSSVNISIGKGFWEIRNQGQPMTIPAERIFDRFNKGTSNRASLGLGLAIAKKIAETNDGSLTYGYDHGTHIFSLRFSPSRNSTKSVP